MGKKIKIGINIRPHLHESLEMLKRYYTLVVYTASHQSYTDAVLELIDPDKKYFSDKLYRNNCIPTKIDGKDFYIKDLSIIDNFDITNMIIIDNSVLSFAYLLDNGIPIVPYYDGEEDSELPILVSYLITIRNYKDLREANRKYIKLDNFYNEKKRNKLFENLIDNKKNEKEQTTKGGFQLCINGESVNLTEQKKHILSKEFENALNLLRNEFSIPKY